MEQEQRMHHSWRRGLDYLRIGNLPAAQACFEGILNRDPDSVKAQLQLATVHILRGSTTAAIRHGELALAKAPDDLEVLAFLAKSLMLSGQIERARETAMRATAATQGTPAARESIASVLTQLGEHRRSLEIFDAELANLPFSAAQYFTRAMARKAARLSADAEKDLESCLAIDPGHALAHWHLAQLHRRGRGAAHAESLRKLLDADNLDTSDRELLLLARFQELDGLGRHADAWQALQAALACRTRPTVREPMRWTAFRSALPEALPAPTISRGPIFIVGLPRSGVGVLGGLLERHPQIHNLGNIQVFSRRINAAMAKTLGEYSRWELPAAQAAMAGLDFAALGKDYIDNTTAAGAPDKVACEPVPMNALLVGAIARALPNAKFLHVSRDLRDNALSLLAVPRSDAMLANDNIAELAGELRQHRDLMQHWHDLLPGRIMDVQYESLVQKPEMVLRVACAFLGLRYAANLDAQELQDRWIDRAKPYAEQLGAIVD